VGGGFRRPRGLNMNTNEPSAEDKALRKLLEEWRMETSLPPQFQDSVWRRIEHSQAPALPSVLVVIAHWFGSVLPRPAFAVAYLSVLLAGGATFGWAEARKDTTHIKDDLSQRYVRVLDPYQAPRQ
jgi:hypothetical protein